MNKPASKEPSMDEILSSIRQIIADDDATDTPAASPVAVKAPPAAAQIPRPMPTPGSTEPLALSAAQIVPSSRAPQPEREAAPETDFSAMLAGLDEPEPEVSASMEEMLAAEPELVDPEDIAFEIEPEPEPEPEPVAPPPIMRTPDPVREPAPRPSPRPAASVVNAAPMPDPTLASDMTEELLEPTTNAAVQSTMARLNAISATGGGQTIEGMMRDLMRPMLKEWLDENLPSLVERVVEREIARISRGVK